MKRVYSNSERFGMRRLPPGYMSTREAVDQLRSVDNPLLQAVVQNNDRFMGLFKGSTDNMEAVLGLLTEIMAHLRHSK